MKYHKTAFELKNNITCILRSALPEDAQDILVYKYKAASETYFLIRYPDEVSTNIEEETSSLLDFANAVDKINLLSIIDEKIVGFCHISPTSLRRKVHHRAQMGITVLQDYWGKGLGRLLMYEAVACARSLGYEQLELGVFSDNMRAISLYKSLGFKTYGTTPRAFKLEDGSYRDELLMYKSLYE